MIEITQLSKVYGSNVAVNNITFKVDRGEIMGFLGPNGAGKTTTMNIMTGYLSSTSGKAVMDGIDILENPMEAKRRIGFLPEQPPLYLDMSVKSYLNFVYDLKKCKLNRVKHLKEICDVVKISDVYERVIGNLSKGYRQRVGIAQALVGNPKVLVFDEPTVGLDPKQIIEIRKLIKGLGKEHTIIISTHILPEAQAVCDRMVIINRGEIIADERTENMTNALPSSRRMTAKIAGHADDVLAYLRDMEGIMYVELLKDQKDGDANSYLIEGQQGVDIRKPLFFNLAQKHYPLVGLESHNVSLEDVFIALVNERDKRKRLSTSSTKSKSKRYDVSEE